MVKAIYWHRDGFALWSKRLERGRFAVSAEGTDEIGRADLAAALAQWSVINMMMALRSIHLLFAMATKAREERLAANSNSGGEGWESALLQQLLSPRYLAAVLVIQASSKQRSLRSSKPGPTAGPFQTCADARL